MERRDEHASVTKTVTFVLNTQLQNGKGDGSSTWAFVTSSFKVENDCTNSHMLVLRTSYDVRKERNKQFPSGSIRFTV